MKTYRIASTPLIFTPNVFAFIMERVKPFHPRKAKKLFESLGLPANVATDLASEKPNATWKTEGDFMIVKMPESLKANTFLAQDENCMKNGSVFRITGRKKEYAAHYMQGDFVRFVSLAELPDNLTLALPKKQALAMLPACFY